MLKDRELETQMQFLDAANHSLHTLETVLLEIQPNYQLSIPKIDTALQATHSIKCGAGMMGLSILGNFAQHLEDSLQVLKVQSNSLKIDTDLHSLLASVVDWLRQIVESISIGCMMDEQWLATFCYPLFEELQKHISFHNVDKNISILSPTEGMQDMINFLFRTEVEEDLQRLESLFASGKKSALKSEGMMIATELASLGEILQLNTFVQLCQSILQHLENIDSDENVVEITQLALSAWRRSQALILSNQLDSIPTSIISLESEVTNQKKSNLIPRLPDTKAINLERSQELLISSNRNENQETITKTLAKRVENVDDLMKELSIQHDSLEMQIDKLNKLIRNLSLRVKKLEIDNNELRLTYDKFATKISTLTQIQFQNGNCQHINKQNTSIDNCPELEITSQTVIETIAKIQEIANEIELSLADTNQVSRLLNKTAQDLQQSITQTPIDLSLERVLLVESDRMLLGFSIDTVEEICSLNPEQVSLVRGSEVFNWHNSTLQLIRLENYLQFNYLYPLTSALETPPQIETAGILIVKAGDRSLAVQIDRCWGERKVSIHQVEGNIPYYRNYTILDDGRIVPLLSVGELLQMSEDYCKL
ncbi:chemotaxis protein CheW [Chlorogloeopsis sp. ULAP01]|uniref:chemotaxis protein CheW n=1 Tax=Chlorogloeopsis sp. ULAP01 TaxID=3056483 RepID=UPI0025AB1C8F|nr:chemotaxis protein CheW [Chlorogloeopsis sp. ULAP01]MDM9384451.1 chemotaxis protein CheW [Chlorogloeopsis sp. ULAP01]